MANSIIITEVVFRPSSEDLERTGLLGWVSCTVNGCMRFNGLSLRRTREGLVNISFPARRDEWGRQHFYFRPLDDATRRTIESQVFAAIGIKAKVP